MGLTGYNDDVVNGNHTQLNDGMDSVPSGSLIEIIRGDASEPASKSFYERLKAAAALVGDHTDVVRAAVAQNAEALKTAAASLREVDESGQAEFQTTDAIIAGTVADTTASDVAASQHFMQQEKGDDKPGSTSGAAG